MCLILFAYQYHSEYPLVLAANRDEFYSRPTSPLAFHGRSKELLAGRDLEGGGTWLAASRSGRIAALTNFRELERHGPGAPSRGLLVTDCALSGESLDSLLPALAAQTSCYAGFNLIAGDRTGLFYCSNRGAAVRRLSPGLYGLSNHLLDTAWPKVAAGKMKFRNVLGDPDGPDPEALFELLRDNTLPPKNKLPDTGVGPAWERILAPIFIQSPIYGTRSSSVILLGKEGKLRFIERTHAVEGFVEAGETREYSITIKPWHLPHIAGGQP
jgi:uncharacterized protein with NRDE domain